jgi:anti-sigma regulatory factor (Ser/Thr protein kinase)
VADDLVEVELPREAIAARVARILLEERFAQTLGSIELDTARLLVTELVTNAVMHGQGRITLRIRLNEDCLFVEVSDEGTGLERAIRALDLRDSDNVGHGLYIVDAESSRWGVRRDNSRVWFELDRPRPRIAEPLA